MFQKAKLQPNRVVQELWMVVTQEQTLQTTNKESEIVVCLLASLTHL